MVEEIVPDLFRIEIPLLNTPLKSLNSYVIKGKGRSLIIDTGLDRQECMDAMQSGLGELGIDLKDTDIFLTHIHADHSGLISRLANDSTLLYCSKQDAIAFNSVWDNPWEELRDFILVNGFPENELQEAFERHPGFNFEPRQLACQIVNEDYTIEIGNYHFKCIETPGHAPGHLCLYEQNQKILISGDHVLGDITPNITLMVDDCNPLKDYLGSLAKIHVLEIDQVLPGHRSLFANCKARIEEINHHHRTRLNEALTIVANGNENAYQVAAKMSWDMVGSWQAFPKPQKLFATWEALAHLKYLEEQDQISKELRDGKYIYHSNNEYMKFARSISLTSGSNLLDLAKNKSMASK